MVWKSKEEKNRFAEENIKLVYWAMERHKPEHIDDDEAESLAMLAFAEAMNRWVPSRGQFSTIYDLHVRNKYYSYIRAKQTGKRSLVTVSLSEPTVDNKSLEDIIKDDKPPFEDTVTTRCLLSLLDNTEHKVICGLYFDGMRQRDIGEALRLSQPQISRIHTRALRKLRQEGFGCTHLAYTQS